MLGVRRLRSAGQRLNEYSIYSGFSEQHQHCRLRFCRRFSYLRGALQRNSQMLGVRQLRSVGQRLNKHSIYSGWSIGVLIRDECGETMGVTTPRPFGPTGLVEMQEL